MRSPQSEKLWRAWIALDTSPLDTVLETYLARG